MPRLSAIDRAELYALRQRLQPALPLDAVPVLHDGPLTTDELAALDRQGWERLSERTSPAGLPLVTMRYLHDDTYPTEERTPGGWRMLL